MTGIVQPCKRQGEENGSQYSASDEQRFELQGPNIRNEAAIVEMSYRLAEVRRKQRKQRITYATLGLP